MYKQISIKNLKVFKNEQKLKIAPITLLYGENSSGKTSILKTLDIVHNIFSEKEVKRGKNVGQKDTPFYRNDNVQNISPKNIHFYSNQLNKKDINISVTLEVLTNEKNLIDNSNYGANIDVTKSKLNTGVFGKYNYNAIKMGNFRIVPLKINLKIKYFKKKEISKVDEILIMNEAGKEILKYKRINRVYKKINDYFDRELVGYLSSSFDKMLSRPNKFSGAYTRGRPIAEEDFFVDDALYSDYEALVKDKSIWEDKYKNYNKIFLDSTKKNNRLDKIKLIVNAIGEYWNWILGSNSVAVDYESFVYIISKKYLSNKKIGLNVENLLKNLNDKKIAKQITNILSRDEKKFGTLTQLRIFDGVKTKKYGNSKRLDKEDRLFMREFLLFRRFTRSKHINHYLIKSLLNKHYSKNKFEIICNRDQSIYKIRFYKKSPDLRFSQIRDGGSASETTIDFLSFLTDYINEGLDGIFYEYKVDNFSLQSFKSSSTHSVLQNCISEIKRTVDNLVICHPSKTNIDWFVARKNDLPKNVLEKILKATEKEKKEEMFRGRTILEKQDERNRLESLKRSKNQIDPSKISADGRNFVSSIVNNDKFRLELNKNLKKLLNLEVKVLTPKFMKEIIKDPKKYQMLRNAQRFGGMYPIGLGRMSKTKFILIRDLKFKKSFEIHGDEIGKGPSNILPFIAQILSPKPSLTYIIQELENNWHPKYQSKVMRFLVEKMKESQKLWGPYLCKNFILETHSELFVLQLKKLVQKGLLSPDDVSINFISRNSNGNSEIHNLPLNSQGGFEKIWPGGFFTERMEVLTS